MRLLFDLYFSTATLLLRLLVLSPHYRPTGDRACLVSKFLKSKFLKRIFLSLPNSRALWPLQPRYQQTYSNRNTLTRSRKTLAARLSIRSHRHLSASPITSYIWTRPLFLTQINFIANAGSALQREMKGLGRFIR